MSGPSTNGIDAILRTSDGTALPVRAFTGSEEISRIFDFQVDAMVPNEVDATTLVGALMTLVVRRAHAVVRRVPALVAEIEDAFDEGSLVGHYPIRFRLVPRAWRMSLRETSEVFVDKTVMDILEEKLGDHGFTEKSDYVLNLATKYSAREFTVQYKESDLAFISRLTEHWGISFYFDERDGHDVVVFTDDPSGFSHADVAENVVFDDGRTQDGVYLLGSRTKVIPKQFKVRDYNYRTPTVQLLSEASLPVGEALEVVEYGTHFKTPSEGKFMAEVRAQERLASRKQYHAKSSLFEIAAGGFYVITDHPRGDIPILVTAVEHTFQTNATGTSTYANDITGIDKVTVYRPERRTPKPKVHGVITGIIDAEASSTYAQIDDYGRYNVTFIFDMNDNASGHASHPVRMAQPSSGGGYGTHFPLRPGVEVMLTCMDGDPDRPIIAGTVPNHQTQSPVNSSNNARNIIRTGGGNEMNIDDTSGSERIKLTTPKGNTSFQLGAPNDAEMGAMLNTLGASTTVAQGAIGTITAFQTDIGLWNSVKTAGGVTSVASAPDKATKGMAALGAVDGLASFVSAALGIATSIKQASVTSAQQQQQTDADKVSDDQSSLDDAQTAVDNDVSAYKNTLTLAQQNVTPVYAQGYVKLTAVAATQTAAHNAAVAGNAKGAAAPLFGITPAASNAAAPTSLYFAPGDLVFSDGSNRYMNTTGGTLSLPSGTLIVTVQAELAGDACNSVANGAIDTVTYGPASGDAIVSTMTVTNQDPGDATNYPVVTSGNWMSTQGAGDKFLAAYAAYVAARAARATAMSTRDTDRDTLYQAQRSNNEACGREGKQTTLTGDDNTVKKTYEASTYAAASHGPQDGAVYTAAVANVNDDAALAAANQALDGAESPWFGLAKTLKAAGAACLTADASKKLAADIAAEKTASDTLSTATDTASASRKSANDLAFVLVNDKDWQNVAATQGVLNIEKAAFPLFSVIYGIYNLVKKAEASLEETVRWGNFGKALDQCGHRKAAAPLLTYNILDGAASAPLNTVGAENTTAVYGDKKLTLWSPMITVHAQGMHSAVTSAEDAVTSATDKLNAEKAKAGTRLWVAQKLAERAAQSALDLAKEGKKLADAALAATLTSSAASDRGIIGVVGDNMVTVGSKQLVELTSGKDVYVSATKLVDIEATDGTCTVWSKEATTVDAEGGIALTAVDKDFAASATTGSATLTGTKTAAVVSGVWSFLADSADGIAMGNDTSTSFVTVTSDAAGINCGGSAGSTMTAKAAEITIATPGNISVSAKLGLSLKATVDCKVEGATVEVASQGTADIKANGPLTLKGAMIMIG